MQLTMITAGLLALLIVVLGFRVSLARRSTHISIGDGGNPLLQGRIRAHGNAVEAIPIALILLALAEQAVGRAWYLGALAAALLVARLLHPLGLALPAPNTPRLVGILGTWGVTAVLALIVLAHGLRSGAGA